MTFPIRPIAAVLLCAGSALAHAGAHFADSFGDSTVGTFSATTAPRDEIGAGSYTVGTVSDGVRQGRPALLAALDFIRAGRWSVGATNVLADDGPVEDGLVAVRSYAGYRHALGPVDVDATLSYTGYTGAGRTQFGNTAGAGYGYAELSAGLRYGPLSARYNTALSNDFFGVPGARGSTYLHLGMRRDLGHAMSLMLHAGDGRVAGSGNGIFDWRDLKAGLNRKLENGWLVAMNYTRAYGAAGPYDRMALPMVRLDARPAYLSSGRRALVLSARRSF
jgi:hypothetical protein